MIHHTMIVSFNDSLPDTKLDQFLKGMEQLMHDSGTVQTYSARRHIRVPVDDHSPVFAATAVVQFGFADLDALNASFVAPGVEEFIRDWKSRFPYQVVWVNHEPLD